MSLQPTGPGRKKGNENIVDVSACKGQSGRSFPDSYDNLTEAEKRHIKERMERI